jgi:glycine cleavage system H protein
MDSFHYIDIFSTKGIEYIIVIFFLFALVPFWRYVIQTNQPGIRLQTARMRNVFNKIALNVPHGIHLDTTHTWAFLEKSGKARIGIDEFLMHITGKATSISMRNRGDYVNRGDLLATITQNGKSLQLYSPINGVIVKRNGGILRNPKKIGDKSFFKDWLYKIEPSNWIADSKLLLLSKKAEKWLMKEYDRLKEFLVFSSQKYSVSPQMIVLQEGGQIQDNVLEHLSNEIWQEFQSEFIDINRHTT